MPELSFRYVSPDRAEAERDLLLLEQERWSTYTGVLTKANLTRYLRSILYDPDTGYASDCGFSSGRLVIDVHVWPLAPGVRFRLRASVGELGDVLIDTISSGESVSFNLSDRATLRHPAERLESVRWLTGPYNADGQIIPEPEAVVSGLDISLSAPVWGSAWIRSSGTRYTCRLTIPREDAEPLLVAGWSEHVIALPEGGRPAALELTPPPGAEELARLDAECLRVSYHFRDGEDEPPRARPADKRVKCDYCALECSDA